MSTELERALNKLVTKSAPPKPLPPRQAAQEIPASRGTGTPSASATSPAGTFALGGPLTMTSSDGLFVWQYSETVVVTIETTEYILPVIG